MSSNTKPSAEGEVNQTDVKFIFECLKHMDHDKMVDLGAVAVALNYTNTASVANRFRALRKRHGFENFEGKNTGPAPKANTKSTPANEAVEKDDPSSDVSVEENVKLKKTKAHRKGAKASSKPIPATEGSGSKTGKKSSKSRKSKAKHALLAAAEAASEEA